MTNTKAVMPSGKKKVEKATKRCSTCNKPTADGGFYPRSDKSGPRSVCAKCYLEAQKLRTKLYRQAEAELRKAHRDEFDSLYAFLLADHGLSSR